MKLQVTRTELLSGLMNVSGAVQRKSQTPVLGNVFLSTKNDKLKLVGTDLEIEALDIVDCVTDSEGEITVECAKLLNTIKGLGKDAFVSLELVNEVLVVKSGNKRIELTTIEAQSFPIKSEIDYDFTIDIEEAKFYKLLKSVNHSMANHDVRYYLNGLYLTTEDGNLVAVSTDGHRLTHVKSEQETNQDFRGVIIPRKAVLELIKTLSLKSDEFIKVNLDQRHVQIIRDDFKLSCNLIEGRYPDYLAAMPVDSNITTRLTIDRSSLIESLSIVKVMTSDKFRGVRLAVNHNSINITANNPDGGRGSDSIEIDGIRGDELEIGFNVDYMLEALNTITDDEVNFSFQGSLASCLLSSANSDVSHVLMPIRL